ncbi:MAG: pirin family protein [Thiobacillaceae bacterium]|nr:pirin family protein [Thiobacillaceae bacterium]
MITLRPAQVRGHADHGWLDTWHSFSFADYYDPQEMGFGSLRVLNEDRIAPGAGFPMHGHRDMEIITWILAGALAHEDSLGNGSVITVGEVQRMSAGTGIRHSERNPSPDESVHLLQIWIQPARAGLAPGYEQRRIDPAALEGRLGLIASPQGRAGSVILHQDAEVYAARLAPGAVVSHALRPGRLAYVQVARGALSLNGLPLRAGDGAKIRAETELVMTATEDAELLLFDMALN